MKDIYALKLFYIAVLSGTGIVINYGSGTVKIWNRKS
jgi:hypothetical protein